MLHLARLRPPFGYRRVAKLLQAEAWNASETRIYRLWRQEGLKVPQKRRKRRRLGNSQNACDKLQATRPNDVWCWDFVFDRTHSGSQLKWLTIVDEFTRECLTLKVDRSIDSESIIDTLIDLIAKRGAPNKIRSDNGPELTSKRIRRWLKGIDINTLYIEPGCPWENGYAESFHRCFRDEFLAMEEFEN